jgi:phosphatidylglycerophosphate synthase
VINVANVVTIGRVFLALFAISLLWSADDKSKWWAFSLTIFVIYADALDGYLARKLKQTSKIGAALDIASDRVVEMVYWIAFAALGWIPVWVPVLFLVRGTFVDTIRAHYSEQGFTAFGTTTMMKSSLGKFLVASNFSRFSYAVAKALAFCLVIAYQTTMLHTEAVAIASSFCVYFACFFCLVRGLPVLFEARELFATK